MSDVAHAAGDVVTGAVDVVGSIPGVSLLAGAVKDFAHTAIGSTVLQYVSAVAGMYALNIVPIMGPALYTVSAAVPGILSDKPLGEALVEGWTWRVQQLAQVAGGQVAGEICAEVAAVVANIQELVPVVADVEQWATDVISYVQAEVKSLADFAAQIQHTEEATLDALSQTMRIPVPGGVGPFDASGRVAVPPQISILPGIVTGDKTPKVIDAASAEGRAALKIFGLAPPKIVVNASTVGVTSTNYTPTKARLVAAAPAAPNYAAFTSAPGATSAGLAQFGQASAQAARAAGALDAFASAASVRAVPAPVVAVPSAGVPTSVFVAAGAAAALYLFWKGSSHAR